MKATNYITESIGRPNYHTEGERQISNCELRMKNEFLSSSGCVYTPRPSA